MVLTADGLRLPLRPTAEGPLLATVDTVWEPLGDALNAAVTGAIPDLAERLERGEDVVLQGMFIARPQPDDNLDRLSNPWRLWTGTEPGDDVYVVGTTFRQLEVVVPRQALRHILGELLRLRSEATGQT
jgi:hypothetical protein